MKPDTLKTKSKSNVKEREDEEIRSPMKEKACFGSKIRCPNFSSLYWGNLSHSIPSHLKPVFKLRTKNHAKENIDILELLHFLYNWIDFFLSLYIVASCD